MYVNARQISFFYFRGLPGSARRGLIVCTINSYMLTLIYTERTTKYWSFYGVQIWRYIGIIKASLLLFL